MKKICYLCALLLALSFASCRKNGGAEVEELLQKVPNTASFVVQVDVESLLDKAGAKVKDGRIELDADLKAALDKNSSNQEFMQALNGDTGVEPSAFVAFGDGYKVYLTGFLTDTDKFKAWMQKKSGQPVEESNGVSHAGDMAMSGNQFWILGSGGSTIDPDKIREYMALSDKQSFASSDFSKLLANGDADVSGWCDLAGMMNTANTPFQQRAVIKMMTSTVFEDANFASFTMNFEKGMMKLTAHILNDKGNDAKFLYASEKLDTSLFNDLKANADGVIGIAVPAKLVKQLQEQTKGQLSMLSVVFGALGSIDGTVAVSVGGEDKGAYQGAIQTNDGSTSDLMGLLNEMDCRPAKQGKLVTFERGTMTGANSPALMGQKLKGSIMGVVLSSDFIKNPGENNALKFVTVKLVPKSGSVILECETETKDQNVNAVKALILSMN